MDAAPPAIVHAGPNGSGPTRAEHDSVLEQLDAIRAEQASQATTLKFIESQVKLTGQAMELLLASQGLDMPEDPDAA